MPQVVRTDTHTGITAEHERKLRRHAASPPVSGFDPNEDPVIIGDGATAGGGSTPSTPSLGNSLNVAIGDGAAATGSSSAIAIGNGPAATAVGAVAIGEGPLASGVQAVALGSCAASGTNSLAGGNGAGALADDSVSWGYNSHVGATHTHSSAWGADAVTTADHQLMLGTAADTVVIPGTLDASGIVGGGHPIAVADSGGTVVADIVTVEFVGTAVTSVTDDGSGHVTVTVDAGSGAGTLPSIVTVVDGDSLADSTIALCDPGGTLANLTLPNPTSDARITVKNIAISGSGAVQIAGFGSETLDGISGYLHLRDGESVTLVSDHTNWWAI